MRDVVSEKFRKELSGKPLWVQVYLLRLACSNEEALYRHNEEYLQYKKDCRKRLDQIAKDLQTPPDK